MKKHRWLWPASHSLFLQNGLYTDVDLNGARAYSDDLLVPGSDDELDKEQRQTKRKRINSLANNFLAGQGLIIPSASLRGPFGETNDDNYPPSEVGILPEPEELDTLNDAMRCAEPTEPAVVPADIITSTMHDHSYRESASARKRRFRGVEMVPPGMQTPSRTPSSSPPSAIEDLLAAIDEGGEDAVGEREPSEASPSMLDGIMNAKMLSFSAIDAADVAAGIDEAKRLSQAAIELPHSSHTLSTQSQDVHTGTPADPHHAHKSRSRPAPNKGAPNASSPFMFRYKKGRKSRNRTATPPASDPAVALQTNKPSPAQARDIFDVPVDDDQDFVERHTNKRLRSSGRSDSGRSHLKGKLRKLMRNSGATFEYDAAAPPTPSRRPSAVQAMEEPSKPIVHNDEISQAEKPGLAGSIKNDRQETASSPMEPAMQISTQAALREAHRDLLKSSPVASLLSPTKVERRPASADASQSPPPAVTPFAKFHRRFAVNEHDTHEPAISTQAIFDAFSPFQISPVKQSAKQNQVRSPLQPSPVINVSSFTPINKPDKKSQEHLKEDQPEQLEQQSVAVMGQDLSTAPAIDAGWSFAALDASPQAEKPEEEPRGVRPVMQPRPNKGLKSMGFKVTKASSQSQSQDSTRSNKSRTKRKPEFVEQESNAGGVVPTTASSDHGNDPDIGTAPNEVYPKVVSQVGSSVKVTQPPPTTELSSTNPISTGPSLSQSKITKRRRRKSLPANGTQIKASQLPPSMSQPSRSRPAINKSDINRSFTPSRPQSFALSDIIADFSSSHPYVDFRNVLSQTSINSLNSGRHSLPAQKRGSVMDWDAESEAGDNVPSQADAPADQPEPSNVSRVVDPMAVTDHPPPLASTGSFTKPSLPASRVRLSFDSQSPRKTGLSAVAEESSATIRSSRKGGLKSSLKKASRESFQDAQKETTMDMDTDFDIDASLNDLKNDVLGGWDVEEEARAL
ncbi:hypothetical protein BDZ85DRAFT_278880 [Elsinoe ampelina]|uniref:Uncharacterized protein n=1 Tax=Elsinoe ampelina TaxID=302913 RepID=A0A6A6GMR6_9PEZI|nr:hypothetical protein BDZ85DRAFT_278880 [Elsinoe ampelina]